MFMPDGEICPQVKCLCQMAEICPQVKCLCQLAKYMLKSNVYARWLNISSNEMFMPDG